METNVELREVTMDNLQAIIKLSDTLTESQKRCVASNMKSVAQGSLSDVGWFRGIYHDDKPIGFIMLELFGDEIPEDDQPAIFLWRFMIGREWQGKGYGKAVLDQIVDHFRKQGVKTMYTSCCMDEVDRPYEFYMKYGFTDTGVMHEDEEILRYAFTDVPSVRDEEIVRNRPWEFMAPKIALITIWTDQIDAMKRFYHQVMGFFIKGDLGSYVEFENRGVRFALCERQVMRDICDGFDQKPQGQRFELAFPCDTPEEVDKAYERLIKLGAGPVCPPKNMEWGQRTALFSDPDGNIHEIFSELEQCKEKEEESS